MDAKIGIRYESLQANLVYLVDIGRKTFIETESRMDKLVMHSRYLFSETGTVSFPFQACDTCVDAFCNRSTGL